MNTPLNVKLKAIGIRLGASTPPTDAFCDIERTILESVLELGRDLRLASLLFTWVRVHGGYVVVEKLQKLSRLEPYAGHPAIPWLSALAAFSMEHGGHWGRKWRRLIRRPRNPMHLLPEKLSESAVALKGRVEYLARHGFIVPLGTLRIRESDVLSPEQLIRANRQYRNRYRYGPSWRADIITAIELGIPSPAAISRFLGCSYEPAHRVFREYRLLACA